MKKSVYAAVVCALVAAALFAGSRLNRQDAGQDSTPAAETESVLSGAETETELPYLPPGTLEISPAKQQLIGVRTAVVEKKPVKHTIRVLGRVEADETRVYRINASVDGWIIEAPYNTVGSLVKKGEILATFYSPTFLDAQQSYLYALGAVDRLQLGRRLELRRKELPAEVALDQLTVQRQIDTLRGMGMADVQIEEIGRTREIALDVRITSPAAGFITARRVSPGERFFKGDELYRIADLSRVWILADVFENEVQYFKPGASATVSIPYQQKTYRSAVSEVLPIFDPVTRTLKVRLETDNPGFVLRPDMFADVALDVELPPAITVPADAVLYAGKSETVFVDRGNGFFEPRKVATGWRMGGRVEIVRGLMPGERIVLAGNFFIDSESRLQAAALGIYGTVSLDPVCGMEVDEDRAKAAGMTSDYAGRTYYFCAAVCKQEFDKAPDQFVEEPAGKHQPAGHGAPSGGGHD